MKKLVCFLVALLVSPATVAAREGPQPMARGGQATPPPVENLAAWECIHPKEAAWNDTGDPYWGGLQMDREFMSTYGSDMIAAHDGGLADTWTPREQMTVANRAVKARGFTPWPQTARECGYL